MFAHRVPSSAPEGADVGTRQFTSTRQSPSGAGFRTEPVCTLAVDPMTSPCSESPGALSLLMLAGCSATPHRERQRPPIERRSRAQAVCVHDHGRRLAAANPRRTAYEWQQAPFWAGLYELALAVEQSGRNTSTRPRMGTIQWQPGRTPFSRTTTPSPELLPP